MNEWIKEFLITLCITLVLYSVMCVTLPPYKERKVSNVTALHIGTVTHANGTDLHFLINKKHIVFENQKIFIDFVEATPLSDTFWCISYTHVRTTYKITFLSRGTCNGY